MPIKQTNHLRDLMEQRGVNFKQISDEIDVPADTLRKVAQNENVQTNILKKLCEYFNCRLSELVEMEPDEANRGARS